MRTYSVAGPFPYNIIDVICWAHLDLAGRANPECINVFPFEQITELL